MLHRFAPLALLVFLLGLVGCSDVPVSDASGHEAEPGDGDGDGAHLKIEGSDAIKALPNEMKPLSVRYIDAYGHGLPGVPVEFALANPAGGASLSPSSPVSDDDGRAGTVLRVGNDPSITRFRVRASADGVEPVYVLVTLSQVARVSVQVQVVYRGGRDVNTRTVTALPSVTCDEALKAGVSGDVTYTYPDEHTLKMFELGPGLHYSLVAWGRDRTNAKVAEGCLGFDAPIEATEKPLGKQSLEIVDTPMRLQGSYELLLDLDVSTSVAHIGEAIDGAVTGVLPSSTAPEGDYYLDALDATLRDAGNTSAADALATRRGNEDLAGALQTKLSDGMAGPAAYGRALGAAVAKFGNRLEMKSSYGIGAMDAPMVTVSMVRARTSDGTDGFEISATLVPEQSTTINAAYSDTLGAVDIATLSLPLGLGSYGKALLGGIGERGEGPRAQAGCGLFAEYIADDDALHAACDGECAAEACKRALDAIDMASVSALTPLDAAHPNIGLRGKVWAHDRTGDGLVDDLGPASLTGSWGSAEDTVTGVVPEPVESNLTQ